MQDKQRFNPYKMFVGSFIPNWLMRRAEISGTAKLVYARLAQYAGKDGQCFPLQETLAGEVGVSLNTASRKIAELVECGLLQSVQNGLGKSNGYFFLWHAWIGGAETPNLQGLVTPPVQEQGVSNLHGIRESFKRVSEESNPAPQESYTIPNSLDTPDFREAFTVWVGLRKLTPIMAEMQLKLLIGKTFVEATEMVRQAIASGWMSIRPLDDFKGKKSGQKKNLAPPKDGKAHSPAEYVKMKEAGLI